MSHKTNKITHLRFLKWRFPHVCGRRARVCCCLEVLLQENVFFFYIQIMDFHMIMDHLDQSNKPVNSECCEKYISAEAQIRYLKSLCLLRLNLLFFSPVSTLCLCSVEVSVTGQENITYHTCVCRHNHEWRRSWLFWFWLDKNIPSCPPLPWQPCWFCNNGTAFLIQCECDTLHLVQMSTLNISLV